MTLWLVLAAAFLGWMFDGMEQGLLTAVARSALKDLLGQAASEAVVGTWISYIMAAFLLGAACGGVAFGWLGDRIGRVRAMALSILAFSVFTGACCFVTRPWQLAGLESLAGTGMGGEWALGVAIVVECWPDRLRPMLSGAIGSAANCGFLLIGLLVMNFPVTPDHWRWVAAVCNTRLLGLVHLGLPARIEAVARGGTSRNGRSVAGDFRRRAAALVFLGIGLASVAMIGTWACATAFLPSWADKLAGPAAKGTTLVVMACGAIVGCLLGPVIAGKMGRRVTYFGMCLCSLIVCQFLFRCLDSYGWPFLLTVGLTGCCTASFYGWFPLYLPELFPTRVRATAQGLSYNSGRIFAMFGVLGTGGLLSLFDGRYERACATISLVYLLGMVLIWFGPETKGKPLPD